MVKKGITRRVQALVARCRSPQGSQENPVLDGYTVLLFCVLAATLGVCAGCSVRVIADRVALGLLVYAVVGVAHWCVGVVRAKWATASARGCIGRALSASAIVIVATSMAGATGPTLVAV